MSLRLINKTITGEILLYLTNTIADSVHKLNKQDIQNNTLLSGVQMSAQKVFFVSHAYIHADRFASLINCVIDDALLEAVPDIDQTLLQFIDIMNLLDPLLHFSLYFSHLGSELCCWVAECLMKWTQVSLIPEDWLSHAQWSGALPYCREDKELVTDFQHVPLILTQHQ